MKGKNLFTLLLVVVVLATIFFIYYQKKKKERQKEINEIIDIINQDINVSGQDDIKSLLYKVQPASGYNATSFAESIKGAPGVLNDDEDAVYKAFGAKTKSQIKSISDSFENNYGQTLDEFLKGWMDDSEYKRVLTIIKSAK